MANQGSSESLPERRAAPTPDVQAVAEILGRGYLRCISSGLSANRRMNGKHSTPEAPGLDVYGEQSDESSLVNIGRTL